MDELIIENLVATWEEKLKTIEGCDIDDSPQSISAHQTEIKTLRKCIDDLKALLKVFCYNS